MEDEIQLLRNENKNLKKAFEQCEKSNSDSVVKYEIKIEEITKSLEDFKRNYNQWVKADLSNLMDGDNVNMERLQKHLHYFTMEKELYEQEKKILVETIQSLECQIKLFDDIQKTSNSTNRGFFSNLFKGSDQWEKKIERLTEENEILKKKEQSIANLTKIHYEKLKLYGVSSRSSLTSIGTNTDGNLIKDLEKAMGTIQKKDTAILKMKQNIDSLQKEIKNRSESREESYSKEERQILVKQIEDLNRKNQKLQGDLNKHTMEYDQLEMKFKNAIEEIEQSKKNVATEVEHVQLVKSVIKQDRDTQTTSDEYSSINTSSLHLETFQISSNDAVEQVFNNTTDISTCPNCGASMPVEQLELHIHPCLETFC